MTMSVCSRANLCYYTSDLHQIFVHVVSGVFCGSATICYVESFNCLCCENNLINSVKLQLMHTAWITGLMCIKNKQHSHVHTSFQSNTLVMFDQCCMNDSLWNQAVKTSVVDLGR